MTFENAIRRLFGVDETWEAGCDESGGGEVQIGDYTWDTEPLEFTLWVRRWESKRYVTKQQTFSSLPEVWEALNV